MGFPFSKDADLAPVPSHATKVFPHDPDSGRETATKAIIIPMASKRPCGMARVSGKIVVPTAIAVRSASRVDGMKQADSKTIVVPAKCK